MDDKKQSSARSAISARIPADLDEKLDELTRWYDENSTRLLGVKTFKQDVIARALAAGIPVIRAEMRRGFAALEENSAPRVVPAEAVG